MTKPVSILSAEWVNERLENVLDHVDVLLDRILTEGFLSSGYLPLEKPLTKELLMKMTPEQVMAMMGSLETPEERLKIMEMMGLPLDEIYGMMGIEAGKES